MNEPGSPLPDKHTTSEQGTNAIHQWSKLRAIRRINHKGLATLSEESLRFAPSYCASFADVSGTSLSSLNAPMSLASASSAVAPVL
jgi:hypothetical protein